MQHDDNTGTRKDMALHRLQVAREDLETAQLLFRENKRHKDTLGHFNKNYVAAGLFPRDLGRRIVKAENLIGLVSKYYVDHKNEIEE